MPLQPSSMDINAGVIVTIGVISNNDRTEIVMPLVTDNTGIDDSNLCNDAVLAFISNAMADFVPCLSTDAYVAYVGAVGMIDGFIPYRKDFAPTDHPGTGGLNPMPSNVTGLILFYAEPDDLAPGQRMRVGKQFMPAVPDPEVDGNIIQPTLQAAYSTFGTTIVTGFPTDAAGGNWFRVCSDTPRTAAPTEPIRTGAMVVRNYVATQRRRLVPH